MVCTALAEHFRQTMGDIPLAHLRTLRLQAAMRLLAHTTHNLEHVAQTVGYQDAFSFSKAFQREAGLSPRDFRRRHEAEGRATNA